MLRFGTSISLLFREHAILDRFEAARRAGFDAIEIQFIDEGKPEEMARAARDADLSVALINLPMGDLVDGGPGLSGVPGREDWFRREAARGLEAARLLGAAAVHVGPSRIPAGHSREQCLATYLANLAAVRPLAERVVLPLLIEPINTTDMPDALVTSLDHARELVDAEPSEALGLQFDLYHLTMNGVDLGRAWSRHRDRVRHVQFSDAPGRHEPGTGTIDFGAIFSTIAADSYSGWTGAEYRPSRPTTETLDWLAAYRSASTS